MKEKRDRNYLKKQKEYEAEALKAIKEKKLMFINHLTPYISFAQSTFYYYELEKSESIKEALKANRTSAVSYMLAKWIGSDNATLQIAAMRIAADEEIRRSLNQQYIEQTIKEQPIFEIKEDVDE